MTATFKHIFLSIEAFSGFTSLMSQGLASFGCHNISSFFRNPSKVGQELLLSYYYLCWKCLNKTYASCKRSLSNSWKRPWSTNSCTLRYFQAWLDSWVKALPHLDMVKVHFSGIHAKLVKSYYCSCCISSTNQIMHNDWWDIMLSNQKIQSKRGRSLKKPLSPCQANSKQTFWGHLKMCPSLLQVPIQIDTLNGFLLHNWWMSNGSCFCESGVLKTPWRPWTETRDSTKGQKGQIYWLV